MPQSPASIDPEQHLPKASGLRRLFLSRVAGEPTIQAQVADVIVAVGDLLEASETMNEAVQRARAASEETKTMTANVLSKLDLLQQAMGDVSENQGVIARELAARARQDSIHETEITAQRAALAKTNADLSAVRLKAAAIKAGLGAGAIAVWEAAKHLFPLLSP